MLDDRDSVACGFVTRSTREVLDGATVSGPPTWACICACVCGVEERGNKPRPLLDVDVDAEREFDEEDAWRSILFVIEEILLWWRLNGRRALTLTILLLYLLELESEEKDLDAPFLGSYYALHSFLELLSVYDVCVVW
jgi:hypothetical protein